MIGMDSEFDACAAVDVNRDGRLDIVASNWGLNDGYHATAEHPLSIHYGDLAGRVHPVQRAQDLVAAEHQVEQVLGARDVAAAH